MASRRRKILLGIGLGLLGVLLTGVGVVAYYWKQATALPDWYVDGEHEQWEEPAPGEDLDWVTVPDEEAPLGEQLPMLGPDPEAPGAKPVVRKRSRKRELRNFHLRARMKNPAVRKAFKASRATYKDGYMEAGVIMDLSKIPKGKLSKKDSNFYRRATGAFPRLLERDIYVGFETHPVTAPDGILQLGADTQIRIGNLTYPISTVAKRIRVKRSAIEKDLNKELRRLKVRDPASLAKASAAERAKSVSAGSSPIPPVPSQTTPEPTDAADPGAAPMAPEARPAAVPPSDPSTP